MKNNTVLTMQTKDCFLIAALMFFWWTGGQRAVLSQPLSAGHDQAAKLKADNWWLKLRQVDTKITACRVTWREVLTISPEQHIDIEKRVARAVEQAHQNGETDAEVEKTEASERRFAQGNIKGRTIKSLLNFVRVGKTVKCEVINTEASNHVIDFYDGKNIVLIEMDDHGKKGLNTGALVRDDKEILAHSAFNWQTPRLLLGFPLEQEFSPVNPGFSQPGASLSEGPNDTLNLEETLKPIPGRSGLEFLARAHMTISKDNLRPLSYDLSNLLYKQAGGRSMGHVAVTGYRQYADGIWFPSKVTVVTPIYTIEYTLQKAAFNEAVDPMELRLPPNTKLADSRFGFASKTVSYKPKDGQLPTDAEVKQMLGENQEKTQAGKESAISPKQARSLSSGPLASPLGFLLIAMGGILWIGIRPKKS